MVKSNTVVYYRYILYTDIHCVYNLSIGLNAICMHIDNKNEHYRNTNFLIAVNYDCTKMI